MYKTFGTHNYYVYILTNKNKTVLYIGVTNYLKERLYAHRNPDVLSKAFTAKYKCYYLIYWEHYRDINTAIDREKQLKGWTRNKKDELIAQFNPTLRFLNDEIED
jgi:putative endonuclease